MSKVEREMGFRELEAFNFTPLAKQGWRFLKFPNSLVARVLQAKYNKGMGSWKQKWEQESSLYARVFWMRRCF